MGQSVKMGRRARFSIALSFGVLLGGGAAIADDADRIVLNVPSLPLGEALMALGAAGGETILVRDELVAGKRSPVISGELTFEAALAQMLDGTGLDAERSSSDAVIIAQADTGSTPIAPPVESIDQIIIYGDRNATTLNDATASVGLVTATDIEDHQLLSFRDAFRTLGNVLDGDWADAGFVIRGVNSEGLTPGGAPLASLYVDGIQQTVNGARRGARGLWDVEQVEVYRGPQSTLSGRASLAGAVYIKTKDPTFDWDAKARVTVGTDETIGGALAFGGPVLEDQIAFRIAGEYEKSENDINYPDYSSFDRFEEFIDDEYYQIRGKVLITPKALPNTELLAVYSFAHDSPFIRDIGGPVLGLSYDERRGDFNLPVFTESRSADTHNAALELTHDFGGGLTFTSLSTYSFNDTERPSVNEGTPGEVDVTAGDAEQTLFTQELRLNYASDRWRNVFGLYYADDDTEAGFDRTSFSAFPFARDDINRSETDVKNAAVFGELVYEFVPSWEVIFGGRGDYTDQEQSAFFSRNGAAITDTESSSDEFVFLPKAGLSKALSRNHTLAFVAQRGFRNGGDGVQRSTGNTFSFDPEFVWNYEVSYKGALLDGRLGVNANVFYADWKNQQVELLEDPLDFLSTITTNAASSRSIGFELEGAFSVTDEFSTFASIGFVDTEFEDFVDLTLGDISGLPFPEAPKWNVAFGGNYESPTGVHVGADLKYVSEYLARFGQDPQEFLEGYLIANLQVGYRTDHFDVTFFAENITDKEYFVYNDRDTTGDIAGSLGLGRLLGVNITANY